MSGGIKAESKPLLASAAIVILFLAGVAVWKHSQGDDAPSNLQDSVHTGNTSATSPASQPTSGANTESDQHSSSTNEGVGANDQQAVDPSVIAPTNVEKDPPAADPPSGPTAPEKGTKLWFDELKQSPKGTADDIEFEGIGNEELQEQIRKAHAHLPGGSGSPVFIVKSKLLLLEVEAKGRQIHFTLHLDQGLRFARNLIPRSEVGFDNYMVDPRSLSTGLPDDPKEWRGGGLFDLLFVMGGYVVEALNPAGGPKESARLEAVVCLRHYSAFDTWCDVTTSYPYVNEQWQQITRTKSLRYRKMLIEQHLDLAMPESEPVRLRFFGKPHDSGLSRDGFFREPKVLKDPISGEAVNEAEIAAFTKYLEAVK
jgi:hypothetical protein